MSRDLYAYMDDERIKRLLVSNSVLHTALDAMRRERDEAATMLNRALHELAIEREKEPRHFMLHWLHDHREKPDLEGVPFFHSNGDG